MPRKQWQLYAYLLTLMLVYMSQSLVKGYLKSALPPINTKADSKVANLEDNSSHHSLLVNSKFILEKKKISKE